MLLKIAIWYLNRAVTGRPTMGKIDHATGKVIW